jgi:hypothetical protein
MNEQYKKKLIERYVAGEATDKELLAFFALVNKGELDALIPAHMDKEIEEQRCQPVVKPNRKKWLIAAVAVVALSIPAYLLLNKSPDNIQLAQNQPEQISPVNHNVTLTLANGQKITLSKKHTGQIATVNGTRINQQDSLLSYQGEAVAEDVKMNKLTNNGSSKFSVTLADGTEAILDVSSSLTYPSNFTGQDRRVSLAGQGYFKVKHNAAHPFIISAGNEVIEDIGTEFNVKAYGDEAVVKTTLIAGAVKVSANDRSVFLKPGEQALDLLVKPANIEEATAWLQGQLVFHHETLENIMRTVSRVYGVTVVWQDPETKTYTFGGSVNRKDQLASVLNYFRKAGKVDFKVEGKTVKVFKRKK